MTDDTTTPPAVPSAQASVADAPTPAAEIAVGDIVHGRLVFGVRKVEGAVFVAFDAACDWQPL